MKLSETNGDYVREAKSYHAQLDWIPDRGRYTKFSDEISFCELRGCAFGRIITTH